MTTINLEPTDGVRAGWVHIPRGDELIRGYLAMPLGDGPFPAVVTAHENLGVTEHRQGVTRDLAKEGFVSLTVDLAARDRAFATRSALEAALLARFAAMPAAELSLPDALERVRTTFAMTSAALVREPTSAASTRTVVASVGPRSDAPPSIRIAAGPGLALEAHGPTLFAEDRRLLQRLAAAAARAWEGQHLAAQADALCQ